MRRTVYSSEHERFRALVREFLATEVVPDYGRWEQAGMPPPSFWPAASARGILGIGVPTEYGGLAGSSFKHSAVVTEEAQRAGLSLGGLRVQTDICMPYFLEYGTEEQRRRWLPGLVAGGYVSAIAITEPGAGSDMKAMSTRAVLTDDGNAYLVNGAKTFITNGLSANLVIVCAKTDLAAGREGISLLVVETDTPGFERGRKLEKLGLRTQDLAELSFTDMIVPAVNLLGEENRGFQYLTSNLAQERLSIALNSQAAAASALNGTVERIREIGGAHAASQNTKFVLAACEAEVAAGQALADQALDAHGASELTPADAAAVKLYCTELQGRVTDRCVQLLGLAGYSRATPAGRAFADGRVSRIYGGSSEIMKVIVAKALWDRDPASRQPERGA